MPFYFLRNIYSSSNYKHVFMGGIKMNRDNEICICDLSWVYSVIWKINAFVFYLNFMIFFFFFFFGFGFCLIVGFFSLFIYFPPTVHFVQEASQALELDIIHLFNNATLRNAIINNSENSRVCLFFICLITFSGKKKH